MRRRGSEGEGRGAVGSGGTHSLQTSKSLHRMLRSFKIIIVQQPLQVERRWIHKL